MSLAWLVVAAITLPAQEVALYRARHRPAEELATLARTAIGDRGRVAVDARTASLVLSGSAAGVARALALLERLDRRLRTLLLDYAMRQEGRLHEAGVAVEWGARRGPWRVGRLTGGPELRLQAARTGSRAAIGATLRLLEGEPGLILIGDSRPLHGGEPRVPRVPTIGELRAESGFEAVATVLASGRVRVELRPFDARLASGGVRYTAVATALEVEPGETVVVAQTLREREASALELPPRVATTRSRETRLLLLRVELEP